MSIPIDKMYHFLQDSSNDNILIYRWFPYGSKKLADLLPLEDYYVTRPWIERMTNLLVVCHDQEPLWYHQFDQQKTYYQHPVTTMQNYIEQKMSKIRQQLSERFNCNDKIIIVHSEKNSKELDAYEQHGFVGVYYWCHALIARDWYRYAQHDPLLVDQGQYYKKDFLIYNRAWTGTREYRLKFSELLVHNNLVSNCMVSFCPNDGDIYYQQHAFKNKLFAIGNTALENYYSKNTFDPSASADYVATDYNQVGIEVVLETLFDDRRHHLTEKTLRPIACGKPFLLASTPGSLKYVRSYGFKTFSDLIDESYDTIEDPSQRLTAIVNEMKRLSQLPLNEKLKLYSALNNIANYNKQKFFSDEFFCSIVDEYKTNFAQAAKSVKKFQKGTYWAESRSLINTDPKLVNHYNNEPAWTKPTDQELTKFLNTINSIVYQ